jgi:hypothetical protein
MQINIFETWFHPLCNGKITKRRENLALIIVLPRVIDAMHQLVLKESLEHHTILHTGHLNQSLFVCSLVTRTAHKHLTEHWIQREIKGVYELLLMNTQWSQFFLAGNWLWPKMMIVTSPFWCETLPSKSRHSIKVLMADPLCNCRHDFLTKTYIFISTDNFSIWFNATWIELRDSQLPNQLPDYRNFRSTT